MIRRAGGMAVGAGILLFLITFPGCQPVAKETSAKDLCTQWSANDNGVECGFLTVPRNWDDPGPEEVRLFYVRLKSLAVNSKKDPIVFLQGGPGGSATALVDFFRTNKLRAEHDIIVMDQRGTGLSEAYCTSLADAYYDVIRKDLSAEEEYTALLGHINECSAVFSREGVDKTTFTSRFIVRDFEALRKSLGIAQWNLFGASYGSRLGLTYLRDYPESVRSAVLQGLFPPEARLYEHMIANLHRSLELVFRCCSDDPGCASRNPALSTVFYSTIASLQERPYLLDDGNIVINAQDYILMVLLSLYNKSTIENNFTALIKSISERNDAAVRAGLISIKNTVELINGAMYLSVAAYEELPFSGTAELEAELAAFPDLAPGPAFFMSDPPLLDAWHEARATTEEDLPVTSDKPVLLVSGNLDPVTPPGNATSVLPGLTNARHIVFENESHSIFSNCFFQILSEFYYDPFDQDTSDCYQFASDLAIN